MKKKRKTHEEDQKNIKNKKTKTLTKTLKNIF